MIIANIGSGFKLSNAVSLDFGRDSKTLVIVPRKRPSRHTVEIIRSSLVTNAMPYMYNYSNSSMDIATLDRRGCLK